MLSVSFHVGLKYIDAYTPLPGRMMATPGDLNLNHFKTRFLSHTGHMSGARSSALPEAPMIRAFSSRRAKVCCTGENTMQLDGTGCGKLRTAFCRNHLHGSAQRVCVRKAHQNVLDHNNLAERLT